MKHSEHLMSGGVAAVWGAGYLGYCNMVRLSSLEILCKVTDYRPEALKRLKTGVALQDSFKLWAGFEPSEHKPACLPEVVENQGDMLSSKPTVHFICVPNEEDGCPSTKFLTETIRYFKPLAGTSPEFKPLVLIETTLIPGTMRREVIPLFEEMGVDVGKDILLAVAPRREWGKSPFGSKASIGRVVAGTSEESTKAACRVLELMGEDVVEASSIEAVELSRVLEMALVQINSSVANQVAQAYPQVDVREVFRLASTNSKISLWEPSLGCGGYSLPLACRYLLSGAAFPELLTIANESMHTEMGMVSIVGERIMRSGAASVAILGFAIKPDINVYINSPALRLAAWIKPRNVELFVCDPHIPELASITGGKAVDKLDALKSAEAVILHTAHQQFAHFSKSQLVEVLKNKKFVLDCTGLWSSFNLPEEGIKYFTLGAVAWLE